ncbi:uncharacterized protein LOC122245112 [Penaeus japonicus]|uniref:uncharacterized protein LOC122245112 n=1 Tax=Penaeus japonicus TaxID=27405 RepID=UPI001C70F477|nr:uncharacterized protein LOC122245112 [Penaeus japonicus]XP_042859007.1 uncharacterized protein LOC122245112 [Penaeus japonicus]
MVSQARWVLSLVWIFCYCAANIQDGQAQKCIEQKLSDLPSRNTSLPGTLTIKPSEVEWNIHFTLMDDSDKTACVGLEVKTGKIQLSLYKTECVEENIVDFQLWPLNYVRKSQWTMLNVTIEAENIFISTSLGESTKMVMREDDLPKGVFQVKEVRGASFSLECQVNCPGIIGSRNRGEGMLSTIREVGSSYKHFYLKPGKGFARLNFEVACETLLGYEVTVGGTDLSKEELAVLVPMEKWHNIFLEYDKENAQYSILVDYRQTKLIASGLSYCHEFKRFLVRAEGETFVSFTCDPSTGEYEAKDAVCETLVQGRHSSTTLLATILITALAVAMVIYLTLYLLGFAIRKERKTFCDDFFKIKTTNTQSAENVEMA